MLKHCFISLPFQQFFLFQKLLIPFFLLRFNLCYVILFSVVANRECGSPILKNIRFAAWGSLPPPSGCELYHYNIIILKDSSQYVPRYLRDREVAAPLFQWESGVAFPVSRWEICIISQPRFPSPFSFRLRCP